MDKIVHARLDAETVALLERLRASSGLHDSEIVRRGIRALASQELTPRHNGIIGQGAFESGVSDLGSNDAHLRGFGKR